MALRVQSLDWSLSVALRPLRSTYHQKGWWAVPTLQSTIALAIRSLELS